MLTPIHYPFSIIPNAICSMCHPTNDLVRLASQQCIFTHYMPSIRLIQESGRALSGIICYSDSHKCTNSLGDVSIQNVKENKA